MTIFIKILLLALIAKLAALFCRITLGVILMLLGDCKLVYWEDCETYKLYHRAAANWESLRLECVVGS